VPAPGSTSAGRGTGTRSMDDREAIEIVKQVADDIRGRLGRPLLFPQRDQGHRRMYDTSEDINMRDYILEQRSRYPPDRLLCTKRRGIMVGNIEAAIRAVVGALHIEGPRGITRQVRVIRLDIASEVFGREITSYNQLSAPELRAMNNWAQFGDCVGLEEFVREHYGEQLTLL